MWYKLKRATMRVNGTEKQIRPKWEWQPWVNTLVYYQFEQNLNDSSGNGYNITTASSYSFVEVWWQYVVQDGWSINLRLPSSPINTIWTWDFTISFWLYPIVPTNVSNREPMIFAFGASTYPFPWPTIFFDYYGYWDEYVSNPNNKIIWRLERSPDNGAAWWVCSNLVNGWHNLVMSRISGVVKCYVDKEQVCQFSSSTNINNTIDGYFVWAALNWSPQWWGTSWAKWDSLILENIWWTSQNVSDYFDTTKATYWIS